MKLMKQIFATINKVETEKNPRPPTYVDPNKTIVASYSQGNELAFGQNAGQQCVAMSLGSLIYNDTQGISTANDLVQKMNIGKSGLFKFVMISQTGIFDAVRITNSFKCV